MRRRTRKEKVLAAIDPSSCLRPVLSQGPPSPFPTTPQMTGEGPWKFLCHRILLCKYLHTITGSVVVVVWPLLPLMRTHLFTFLYSFLSLSRLLRPGKKREKEITSGRKLTAHITSLPRVCVIFFFFPFLFVVFLVYTPHTHSSSYTQTVETKEKSLSLPFWWQF